MFLLPCGHSSELMITGVVQSTCVCVAGTQLCGWKNILCLLIRIKEHCVLLGGTEALDSFFFRQRKPRKMPLNDLAPVQVPTRVG